MQLADLVAYIVSWGVQVGEMKEPARPELADLAAQVCQMRYRTMREVEGNPNFIIWSFTLISDLRPTNEREP